MAEYDTITVGAGETFRKTLSDDETWENKLIDISAQGASFLITAHANNWTIRNVGAVGNFDTTQNSVHPMDLEVPDPNSTGTVENVCLETTTTSDAEYGNGPGGPYVRPEHEGHITFDRVYLQHFQDNGIYASAPGNSTNHPAPGHGGTIEIRNSYAYRCGTSGFRLGTTGSEIVNSVAVDNHRGYWAFYESTEVTDCDFVNNNTDIFLGDASWEKSNDAEVTMNNSRWNTEAASGGASTSNINGSSVGTPQDRVPEGCPTTAEGAASEEPEPSPDPQGYDTITVGAGETFSKSIGDNETWENKLIDVSASGASYSIHANGTNWTIRNIGIQGTVDAGSADPFTVRDTSSDGESVIENVYLGDGAADGFQWNTHQVTGIYVHADHAGDLLIDGVYINEFRDNAFYGSDPGHPTWDYSAYGTVRIENCFARNGGFNFRISTEGSYCKNCVSVIDTAYNTGSPTGYYDYFSRGLEYIDCDSTSINYGWANGSTAWPEYVDCEPLTLTDCRVDADSSIVGGECPDNYNGSPGSSPRTTAPEGCPTTAVEAANGTGTSGGGTSPSPDPDPSGELSVTTGNVKDVTDTSATLTGSLDSLGQYDMADVYFEYRKVDDQPIDGGGGDGEDDTDTGDGDTGGGGSDPSPQEYDTITVDSWDTYTKRLSDGETWENKLIDVSAPGAAYDIRATGSDWTIRNIGVKGPMDVEGGKKTEFITMVDDPDGKGVIDNIYLGYETTFDRSASTSPMGLFVHAYHVGDIEVNNFYCTDMPSHAIYGSGPGNPDDHPNPGGEGTVRIHNSYAADLENSGWRIGTPGSYVENSVCFRAVRGIWAYYGGAEARDCDLGDNGIDIVVGTGSWSGSGDLTVENTRFETKEEVDTGRLVGSSAGTPEERVPDSCPESAEDAAQGL